MSDPEPFVETAVTQLLRAQLAYVQEKLGGALYRQKRAEDLLGKYLTTLFSVAWGQATASRADVLSYAEAMLGTLSGARPTTPDTPATAALDLLRQYLEIFAVETMADATPDTVMELARQQLPIIAQQWATRNTAAAPDAADVAAATDVLRQYLTALQAPLPDDVTLKGLMTLANQYLPTLNQRLTALPPAVVASMSPAPAITPAVAVPPLSTTPTLAPPPITLVSSSPIPAPGPTLPDAAIEAWRVIGREPSWEKAEPLFVQTTGHTPTVFRDMVEVLVQHHLLGVLKAPVSGRHEPFCNPRLFDLTPTGATQYHARFGFAPVRLADFLGKYHITAASPITWWLIRATRNAILNGRLLPDNPFAIEVFDLAEGIPDGYQREYGECRNPDKGGGEQCSVPDLFVELQARGGPATRLCVECERGRYANQALKQKLRWTMHNYGQAGFAGVYYVAPAAPEARLLQRALGKLAADLRQMPVLVEKGMLAIFTFDALIDRWLPSPAMVDRWESGVPAEGIPTTAARAVCRLKHRQRGGNTPHLSAGEN